MNTTFTVTFPVSSLLSFTNDVLRACGLPGRDADITAKAMIEADLTGADAHGIFRLASYVKVLQQGRINPRANMRIVNRGPATALMSTWMYSDGGIGGMSIGLWVSSVVVTRVALLPRLSNVYQSAR